MRQIKIARQLLGVSALLALAVSSVHGVHAQLNPVGVNLLQNPGHEHPGVYFAGRGEINVSWGWVPFWEEPPAGVDPRDPYYRTPEFRPVFAHEYPNRVKSGGGRTDGSTSTRSTAKQGSCSMSAICRLAHPFVSPHTRSSGLAKRTITILHKLIATTAT